MRKINALSIILFLIFISLYLIKLVILYKKNNIKANVLGNGSKDKETNLAERFVKVVTFIWGLIWVLEAVGDGYINKYIPYLFGNIYIRYIGVVLLVIGVIIFGIAAFSMRNSWRVGIDKNTKTTLIKDGIYKYSRNPAFVGFNFMFVGTFVSFPNILTFVVMILSSLAIHRLIIQEEKHLEESFGIEYMKYKKTTGRYF